MGIIDEELRRLRARLNDLELHIIPDFEGRAESLFTRIMPLPKDGEERERLEAEYVLLSKELSLRSKEMLTTRHEIENLELQKNTTRR